MLLAHVLLLENNVFNGILNPNRMVEHYSIKIRSLGSAVQWLMLAACVLWINEPFGGKIWKNHWSLFSGTPPITATSTNPGLWLPPTFNEARKLSLFTPLIPVVKQPCSRGRTRVDVKSYGTSAVTTIRSLCENGTFDPPVCFSRGYPIVVTHCHC